VFEHQKVTIKSGKGSDYFEADVSLDTMASSQQTQIVMDGLRKMQQDRMSWIDSQRTINKAAK
jgi:hypothetical protein